MMKKTLFSILAVMLCMIFVFAGCGDNSNTPGSIVDNTDGAQNVANSGAPVQSDNKIVEGETVSESNLGADIEIFMSNEYYLEGTIYSDNQAMPVTLATDGTNVQLTATVSGIGFGVLVLDDKTYAIQPNAKVYTELSNMLVSALGLDSSINISDFHSIQQEEGDDEANIKQTAVTINGTPGLCTDFVYDDTSIKLYSIGDQLIQVENFDEKGNLTMQIVVDEITPQIPSDQLTLKGLTQASVPQFISSFLG